MKRTVLPTLAAMTALACAQVHACDLTDLLVSRYGITFAGFAKPIAASAEPDIPKDASFVRARIHDRAMVNDGFQHTVLLDVKGRRAWILRTGGFAPVRQWYGPVDVGGVSAAGCADAPSPPAHLNIVPAWDAANKKGAGGSLDARAAGNQAVGGT